MRLVVSDVVTCYIGAGFMMWAWLKIGSWWAGWWCIALKRLFLLRFLIRVERGERLTAAVLELLVNRATFVVGWMVAIAQCIGGGSVWRFFTSWSWMGLATFNATWRIGTVSSCMPEWLAVKTLWSVTALVRFLYFDYCTQEWFDVENVFVGRVRFKVNKEHGKISFCLVMFYICDLPSWETNSLNCWWDIRNCGRGVEIRPISSVTSESRSE